MARLEAGELDYILTVDVFNEGVDIPTINQVVMLRQTKSAIVFVQQLGRGLRKAPGKDYLVVIDFIGNYANNYLIPIALFGDESLNKESLRKNLIAAEESGVLPGLSSVRFDRIAQERVLQSITAAKLDSMVMLKAAVTAIHERVGGVPSLWDFLRFESVDPVVLATKMRELSDACCQDPRHVFWPRLQTRIECSGSCLTKCSPRSGPTNSASFDCCSTTARSQRSEIASAFAASGIPANADEIESAIDTLTLENHAEVDHTRYDSGIAERMGWTKFD